MPPIPPPSPEKRASLIQRKQNIERRDRRTAEVLRQYEEQGENRRAALKRINPFEGNIRTTILPAQTIPSPNSRCYYQLHMKTHSNLYFTQKYKEHRKLRGSMWKNSVVEIWKSIKNLVR